MRLFYWLKARFLLGVAERKGDAARQAAEAALRYVDDLVKRDPTNETLLEKQRQLRRTLGNVRTMQAQLNIGRDRF